MRSIKQGYQSIAYFFAYLQQQMLFFIHASIGAETDQGQTPSPRGLDPTAVHFIER